MGDQEFPDGPNEDCLACISVDVRVGAKGARPPEGEVPMAPRWCTVTYIEGESLKPNEVSSDLERFENGSYLG